MTDPDKRNFFRSQSRFPTGVGVALLAYLLSSHFVRADVTISLPLEGHYRPGRYMPVRVANSSDGGAITLSAAGAVPTELEASSNRDAIVPWLAVTAALRDPRWNSAGSGSHAIRLPLRVLEDNEKLIGVAGEDPDAARPIFPEKTIVPIALDISQPVPGPAEAWETLDALLMSEAAFVRLKEDQWQTLAAAGTALIVRSEHVPADGWPWRKVGDYWVLWHRPVGPDSLLEPDVYLPTYGWERGWPASFRRQAIFAALVFSILATAATLWRSRWAIVVLLVLCGATVGGVVWWYSRQSPVFELAGGVSVRDDATAQFDLWSWRSPVRATADAVWSFGLTQPSFASAQQIEQTGIRLIYRPGDETSRFAYHLDRGQSLAFFSRSLIARSQSPSLEPASGVMKDFAEQFYLRPPARVLGQYMIGPRGGSGAPLTVIVVGTDVR